MKRHRAGFSDFAEKRRFDTGFGTYLAPVQPAIAGL
jgi:hypothetical protein